MVVNISEVNEYVKPLATSTLMAMKKKDLVEYVRALEHNYNVSVTFNNRQAEYMEKLFHEMGVKPNPPLTHDSATAPSRGRAELDSAQALDAPAALSLEELREMEGGPSVWVVIGKRGFYDIFCDISTDGIAQFYRAALPEDEYGKTWLAYRRKPEEVACAAVQPPAPAWAGHFKARFERME